MPRAALISWDGKAGAIILSAGPNTFHVEHTGDMQKDAETLARLCRYLQALAPQLPPAQPRKVESNNIPEVTEEEMGRAQRFTAVSAARGAPKLQKATREDVLNLLANLPVPQQEPQE